MRRELYHSRRPVTFPNLVAFWKRFIDSSFYACIRSGNRCCSEAELSCVSVAIAAYPPIRPGAFLFLTTRKQVALAPESCHRQAGENGQNGRALSLTNPTFHLTADLDEGRVKTWLCHLRVILLGRVSGVSRFLLLYAKLI